MVTITVSNTVTNFVLLSLSSDPRACPTRPAEVPRSRIRSRGSDLTKIENIDEIVRKTSKQINENRNTTTPNTTVYVPCQARYGHTRPNKYTHANAGQRPLYLAERPGPVADCIVNMCERDRPPLALPTAMCTVCPLRYPRTEACGVSASHNRRPQPAAPTSGAAPPPPLPPPSQAGASSGSVVRMRGRRASRSCR